MILKAFAILVWDLHGLFPQSSQFVVDKIWVKKILEKINIWIDFKHLLSMRANQKVHIKKNNGDVLEIYLDRKFQWPQESLNCGSLRTK